MPHSTCSVPECNGEAGKPGTARGMCSKHYNRWRRNGDPLIKTQRTIISECSIPECGKPHDAQGLCSAHITNLRRHGEPSPRKKGSVVGGRKLCADCKQDLPVSSFYTAGAHRFQARCKECAAARAKSYRESRQEVVREQYRLSAAKRVQPRRDAARKRRAAIRLAAVEDVVSIEVYDRALWVCGICGCGIPRVTIWPHPESASLDHVIPISLGGAHSYANTQPAHLVCNMRKGATAA